MDERLAAVEAQLGLRFPNDVRSLYAEGDGRYDKAGEWWVVWPIDRLIEENRSAWRNGLPASCLAFGDDGTGDPFYVDLADGPDVHRWSFIDAAPHGSEGSVPEFVATWIAEDD